MSQVFSVYPSAQRDLLDRYHIGGCNSCGFAPTDRLETVCVSHGLDLGEVVRFIEAGRRVDEDLEVAPEFVSERLKAGRIRLLDVRTRDEFETARIDGSMLVDEQLSGQIVEAWERNTPMVILCHHGVRSLHAAAYLKGHGFTDVKSMKGGIDAWSVRVDASVARY